MKTLTADEIYWLHLQNNTEHDTFEEAFKAGIECALEEANLPENCNHPFKEVVSGDEGMYCITCQKYI